MTNHECVELNPLGSYLFCPSVFVGRGSISGNLVGDSLSMMSTLFIPNRCDLLSKAWESCFALPAVWAVAAPADIDSANARPVATMAIPIKTLDCVYNRHCFNSDDLPQIKIYSRMTPASNIQRNLNRVNIGF